ncbi:MAG TPA: PLxRFG domain-containing protein, partial [Rhodocyclaceae bacterium]|nr:PLxRFG domain-containing protein [Rhodocyclaceae bacterium]
MSNCSYRFTGPDGKEVTIVGKATMKAYMVANLDFFRSLLGANAPLRASLPAPASARSEPTDDLEASGMVPLASRRASAAWTGETPERIRRVLADEFGEEGIARLERAGFLRIVPDLDAVPAGLRIDGAEAVYDPAAGIAYLVADRLSADRAPAALLHELGEHHGLEGFVGKTGWRAIKAKVARLSANPASMSHEAWRAIKATYPEFKGMADADLAKNDRFIHEVLAKLGESPRGRSQSLWLDLEGFIKRGLLRMGLTFLFGEHDVPALVDGSLRRLMRKGRKAAGNASAPERPMASIPLADALLRLAARQAIRDRIGDLFHSSRTFNVLHRTVGTQYHKAKVDPRYFGRVFNMAQQYIDDISRTANEAADVAPDLLPKMERMADAFKQLWQARADAKDAQALAAPIFEGTMSDKVWSEDELRGRFNLDDRQIGLYRQFRAAVDRSLDELALSEMSRTAKMAKLQPAPREMSLRDALAFYMEQIGPDIERLHGDLADLKERQRFEREQLEEAAQNGDSGADERRRYADLRESMNARHAAESAALKARIEDMAELLKATQGKVEQIEHLKATGYAPLMRFGQYTVDVFESGDDGKPLKDADGEEIRHFFGMFESEAEANEAARALREEYPNATINQGVMSQDSFRLFRGVTPETVEVFARMMGEEQSEVFQKYLKQAVNNRSALKRLIQRKGIAGFEKDPVRVLATFLTSNARATAANYHFGDMLRAASEIPKEKGDVKDEAIKLIDYIQNPGDEAASLRGLLFMHFLGGSVAAAMVNMTQTFTMTFPYLAQFGGDVAGNLKEAMGLAGRRLFNKNADVPEELKMALQRASDEGVVSPHEIHMLQGESMRTGWFQNNRYMRSIGKVWGSFFSLAEHFNRDVAFIAAYRSALQRNLSDEQAYEFAKDAVRETQGVYSRANRPNWARGAVGATIFTFKQFTISYLEFLKRLP